MEDQPLPPVYLKLNCLCRNFPPLHFQDGNEAGCFAMTPDKCQLNDSVCETLYFRKSLCGDGPGRTCHEEYTSSLLDLGSDSLQKRNRLLTLNSIENRRKRVQDQSNRLASSMANYRRDTNIEFSQVRWVFYRPFTFTSESRVAVHYLQASL